MKVYSNVYEVEVACVCSSRLVELHPFDYFSAHFYAQGNHFKYLMKLMRSRWCVINKNEIDLSYFWSYVPFIIPSHNKVVEGI